jgi:hypothetical protein
VNRFQKIISGSIGVIIRGYIIGVIKMELCAPILTFSLGDGIALPAGRQVCI